MTQAPERIYIDGDTDEDDHHGKWFDSPKHVNNPPIEYTRADLTPRWRPIAEWDGEEFIVMTFQTSSGIWVTTESIHTATHFMQLAPPGQGVR